MGVVAHIHRVSTLSCSSKRAITSLQPLHKPVVLSIPFNLGTHVKKYRFLLESAKAKTSQKRNLKQAS